MRQRRVTVLALSPVVALSVLVSGLFAVGFWSASSGAIDHGALSLAIRASIADAAVAALLGVLLVTARRYRAAVAVLGISFVVAAVGPAALERVGTILAAGDRIAVSHSMRDVWDTMTGTGAALVPTVWIVGAAAVLAAMIVLARQAGVRLIRAV